MSLALPPTWTASERTRLAAIVTAVAALHVAGVSLALLAGNHGPAAGGLAGAGVLAYFLGVRHAFDADHIAAIDDTTRLMLIRGRRPVGVGFFFAMGHSAVVLILAVVVSVASTAVTAAQLDAWREVGAQVAVIIATVFLLLVAGLNAVVLRGLSRLWARLRVGALDERELDLHLLNRGLVMRLLGSRAGMLVRSSWHMAAIGFLFGLGLETASEVTLLALAASTASAGVTAGGSAGVASAAPTVTAVGLLSLPLLFAAGMSAMDTADSLLMVRAYSWAHRSPGRRLYYNLATTAMTVLVGSLVASVYAAGLVVDHIPGADRLLGGYAGLAEHFELFGYVTVGLFASTWLIAVGVWRWRGYGRRFGGSDGSDGGEASR